MPGDAEPLAAAAVQAARGDEAVAAAPSPSSTIAYTVSVRGLCEFTAKHGDLDRRFTPSATALEGIAGQAAAASRRGAGYQSEVALEGVVGTLRVRGRADGFDPARGCVEEIKTIRGQPDAMPQNRRDLHAAQLETYGALLCRTRGLPRVELALVYVDADTQAETVLRRLVSAAELDAALTARCRRFEAWSRQEAAHQAARDAALGALAFPLGGLRPGQRVLAEAVYRAALGGRCLLAQAPTGIGKTLGTLYPLLRAMPGRLDKIGYLTCKGTARATALDALRRLRGGTAPGLPLRVLALVAKDAACEHPGKACHGDDCPLARGFYDRLPAARAEAVDAGWLDPAAQRRIALRHGVCPYYLGQELLRWVDVVVADVHHAFDPHGQLFGLAQAQDWRLALLVDEAHNLVERTRRMYSADLGVAGIRLAMQAAPAPLRPAFRRLIGAAEAVAGTAPAGDVDDRTPEATIPDALSAALQQLVGAIADHLRDAPLATGPLLQFHFEALRFQRLVERFGPHSIFDAERRPMPIAMPIERAADDGNAAPLLAGLNGVDAGAGAKPPDRAVDDDADAAADAVLSIRNVVPGAFLSPRFAACRTVVLFSATLAPEAYQRDLLGLPDDAVWVDVPPPFPPERLRVRVTDRLSTRYRHRRSSLDAVADLMARQFAAQPGNYLGFFSSFDYLAQAADRLAARHPGVPQWRQTRAMNDAARGDFLARFAVDGRGVGFAVLGGAFGEGVDLPGSRLIGAFIATLGLPPPSPVHDAFRRRLDTLFGAGTAYADLVPGMQRVVQAAGRVIRSPDDEGWLWLMDDRYARPEVAGLLPSWWGL